VNDLLPDEAGVCLAGELAALLRPKRTAVQPTPATRKQYGGAPCLHCRGPLVNRPRGLCWTCYYTPSVREQYPFRGAKFTRRGSGIGAGGSQAVLPTTAQPGSAEKVAVLEERARLGLSLWHPDDAPMDAESRALGLGLTW
jgi:hypothetical protein